MNGLPVDVSFVVKEATQNELVNRKLSMDALKARLGDQRTKQEKLRETCEGFEAVFIQKLWEQMRKNVPKEGYLHSKDEETYQSLFDVELSKKMSGAGGIGLADMLYEQLSQQLEDTGRTTTPGSYRKPLQMDPIYGSGLTPQKTGPVDDKKLTASDLYSDLDEQEPEEEKQPQEDEREQTIAEAVDELRKQVDAEPEMTVGEQIRREILASLYPPAPAAEAAAGQAELPAEAEAAAAAQPEAEADDKRGILSTSWRGPGPVSASPKPISPFAGRIKNAHTPANEQSAAAQSRPRGMVPSETVWPLEGDIVGNFGWEEEPSGGRHWNQGIAIAARPGAPVRAILDGSVIFAGEQEGFGHTVVLEHKDGFTSRYGNVESGGLAVGDAVSRGANFAQVGGQASLQKGPENSALLHFTLKRGEMALNPEAALKRTLTAQR